MRQRGSSTCDAQPASICVVGAYLSLFFYRDGKITLLLFFDGPNSLLRLQCGAGSPCDAASAAAARAINTFFCDFMTCGRGYPRYDAIVSYELTFSLFLYEHRTCAPCLFCGSCAHRDALEPCTPMYLCYFDFCGFHRALVLEPGG